MTFVAVSELVLGACVLMTFPTLTAFGARRRARGLAVAVVAGIFFPVTWTVWYVRDEHPYRRALHHG